MDQPVYSVSKVAASADLEPNTLRSWYQRGHLKLLQSDQPAEENGLPHLLSLRSALYVGTVSALVKQFVPPAIAGQAALGWIHGGREDRNPGALFKTPLTVLCVYADGTSRVRHMPLSAQRKSTTGKTRTITFYDLFQANNGAHHSVTAVILDFVDRQVRTALVGAGS